MTDHIIVHPGGAHLDEILATGLVCRSKGAVPVYRRKPTEADLADPSIWVLDVGRRHEPELNNFDHHQFDRDVVECALSLVAKHLGLHDLLSGREWYMGQVRIDVQGPRRVAEDLGLNKPVPPDLESPLDLGLVQLWMATDGDQVPPFVVQAVTAIVDALVAEAEMFDDELARLRTCTDVRRVAGLPVLVHETVPYEPVSMRLRAEWEEEHGEVIPVSVGYDSRGPGMALNRLDDDPRIDFVRISSDDRVAFAHGGGFVAKTKARRGGDAVVSVVEGAVVGA